jgi:hypothetical protein
MPENNYADGFLGLNGLGLAIGFAIAASGLGYGVSQVVEAVNNKNLATKVLTCDVSTLKEGGKVRLKNCSFE